MLTIFHRAARGAAFVSLVAALAACGDEEPAQRKAFMAFLQDINGRTGTHVLKPNAKDEKDFGPYFQQYKIIIDYNNGMRVATEAYGQDIGKLGFGPHSTPRTIEQMAATPQDLVAAKQITESFEHATEVRLADTQAKHDALKQPDDLKAVYDKAFGKLVTTPTLAFENSSKALLAGLDASIKLTDYINGHRTKLSVSGMQVQAKDQRTLDEVGALIKAHAAAGEKFVAAQRDGLRIVNDN
jgi:Protein of unknown function (DUF3053)